MKVSCLTFHDSTNYGTVLQAYALQTVVTRLGHDYEIINYSNAEKHKHDSLFRKNRELSNILYLYKLINLPQSYWKQKKFRRFTEKYLQTTQRFYTAKELQDYADTRDAILVGSDQVWNCRMIREDPAYFLRFAAPAKRIAYAASIGLSTLTMHEQEFYREMLSEFHQISVREPTAAKLLEEIAHKNAEVVLDPTLLLTSEDWAKVATTPPPKPYIFAYVLEHNSNAQAFLKNLQKQTGLPVHYVSRGVVSAIRDGATYVPSPQEWVSQIMHAEYVVTSSFHGTAFSVNFRKNFFTFVNGSNTQSRQIDFLRAIGLEKRLNPEVCERISLDAPDFSRADSCLRQKRAEAIAFLKTALAAVRKDVSRGKPSGD